MQSMVPHGRFEELCEELVKLLEEQVAVIKDRGLSDFSKEEMADFERRKLRVAELRAAIGKLVAMQKN